MALLSKEEKSRLKAATEKNTVRMQNETKMLQKKVSLNVQPETDSSIITKSVTFTEQLNDSIPNYISSYSHAKSSNMDNNVDNYQSIIKAKSSFANSYYEHGIF